MHLRRHCACGWVATWCSIVCNLTWIMACSISSFLLCKSSADLSHDEVDLGATQVQAAAQGLPPWLPDSSSSSSSGGCRGWQLAVREGLSMVLRSRVGTAQRFTALRVAAGMVQLAGPKWLLEEVCGTLPEPSIPPLPPPPPPTAVSTHFPPFTSSPRTLQASLAPSSPPFAPDHLPLPELHVARIM